MTNLYTKERGMSLIDVIVGTALVLIIFLALMGVLRASILVASLAKSRAGAASIASSQMEYLRGISYDSLGTVGGIPAGVIPQTSTIATDGTTYTVHTYIQYIDDPADGLGAYDTNGIITDYKLAKISVDYFAAGKIRTTSLLSNFVPLGIETTNGGGTLAIHVINTSGAPISGATVHIIDVSTTPTIDLSTFSNVSGMVYLPGAATSTQYQIFISKNGYSSAQTYVRDTTNQNPTPGFLTVVKDKTTTGTFVIDTLASFTPSTFSPEKNGTFSDTFFDATQLSTTTNTTVSSGALTLAPNSLFGSAGSVAIAPAYLQKWVSASISTSTPASTGVVIHLYDTSTGTSTSSLIPDTVLPGNAAGFTSSPINLSSISTTTYTSLGLVADLSATATTTLPKVLDWKLSYVAGPTPLPNAPFTLTGTKTIGSTGAGVPIYKTVVSTTTDVSGSRTLILPPDAYTLVTSGGDIENTCPFPPYALAPGSTNIVNLTLVTPTTNRLLVLVQDSSGGLVTGATVTLSRTGYTKISTSSACGVAYFGGLNTSTNYTVTIAKSGYTKTTFSNVNVVGQMTYSASFP